MKPILNKPAKISTNINIKQVPTVGMKPSPNISKKSLNIGANRVGKSSEKKLDPVRTKLMSHSIALK